MYVTTTDHEDGQSVALLTAYRAGLEEAAKVCESLDNAECDTGYGWTNTDCAEAIRALKDKP
jgi:hypothetical protein